MRDLLVAAIVFGALPFILKRPWIGILVWSWLGYMNPHRLTWGFAFDFPFAMIVAIVTIVAFLFSREKKEMIWSRETVVLLIFIGWMFITTVLAFYPADAWMQWNKVWKIQLIIFLTVLLINDRQKLNWMIWVIVLSLGFYGVKGGIFTILNGGSYRVWGPANTFIGGNNEVALAMVMTIPLIRYLHLQETRKWLKSGLAGAMVLTAVAAIGSQSRGALLALAAMGLFLWLKSRHKLVTGIYMVIAVAIMAAVMPQEWYDRMNTIKTYEEDRSAMGRINAWHTAFNVATARVTGGGFEMLTHPATFRQYAPNPFMVHDAHSIYFEVVGEHGFIGLLLFVLIGLFAWIRAQQVIKRCRHDPGNKWAADLSAMIQVSLVGYATGGAFLGLAYFDLPYHLMIIILLTAKFTGVLGSNKPVFAAHPAAGGLPPHPSSRFDQGGAGRRI
jgi:probable O-glycosylation ligase (exosortase A-associated)